MPRGPRGEKRPADVIGAAIMITPAMAAGITDKLWSVEDIVTLVEASEPKSGKRGPYKKRAAA
jgi:hypothetical protein